MSVEKLDTVKLLKEKIPYTIHSNYVLQNLCEPLPLAIWCYLTSLPDDWEIYRNQLMNHFNIGRDKLGTSLKFLKENRLIEYLQSKFETGKFSISHILVKNGVEFEVIHRNNTALLKNRTTDLPLSGESAPTNTIRNTNKIKNKNKSFCEKDKQKKIEAVGNIPGVKITPVDWKEINQKKHSWSESKKESKRADVTNQSTSFDKIKHSLTERVDTDSASYQAFVNSVPSLRRRYQRKSEVMA